MARRKLFFFSRERQTLILYLIAKIQEVDHPPTFRMLRSVNAPSPSRLAVRKTDDFLSPPFSYPLSFPYRLSSSFLRRNRSVRCFWCSPTPKRIRSAENVVAVRRRRLASFSFYVRSLPFPFFRLCYSPPRFSCYSILGSLH